MGTFGTRGSGTTAPATVLASPGQFGTPCTIVASPVSPEPAAGPEAAHGDPHTLTTHNRPDAQPHTYPRVHVVGDPSPCGAAAALCVWVGRRTNVMALRVVASLPPCRLTPPPSPLPPNCTGPWMAA
eukprot:GHVU01090520.1.p1 GENE.GHVU01090520.1~~GHVU01090520.1.p1  ORF type:complete len:127 (+),score=12.60 GHVU01090520.1:35-415(+)